MRKSKTIIKTFRLTPEQAERFKTLKGFRHKWEFSEIVILALEELLLLSDRENLLKDRTLMAAIGPAGGNTNESADAVVIPMTPAAKATKPSKPKKAKVANDAKRAKRPATPDPLRADAGEKRAGAARRRSAPAGGVESKARRPGAVRAARAGDGG